MKPLRTGSVVLGFALITFVAGTAAAEDKVVTFGVSADYFSKYIWRGQNVDNSSVLQPTISASAYGFTGSIWGNIDLTNRSKVAPDNAWEFSEYDLTLDYTNTIPGIDWLSGSVGTIYYQFPNQVYDPTTEIYGGFGLPKVPLTPSFKWYRDVQAYKGSYFQFGVGQLFDKLYVMNENCYCGLQLGASYGWGNAAYDTGYFGVNSGQSNDLTLSAALCTQVYTWMIKPSINYSTMLSDSIREATDKSDNLWVGVGISTSF
ncbi:MAG: hypothetical protein ABSG22_06920 [Sedimentisphaerales bacterium]